MFAYCFNNPANLSDPTGNWPKWLETTVKVVSAVLAVVAVVTTVVAVSAYTAETGSVVVVYGASILLGAAVRDLAMKSIVTSSMTQLIGKGVGGIDYKKDILTGGVADGCGGIPIANVRIWRSCKGIFWCSR